MQDNTFLRTEGNAYFRRNQPHMTEPAGPDDTCLRLLDLYSIRPQSALEVGASNGYRLAALLDLYNCPATGVEPSQEAIADGRRRFPGVVFKQGVVNAVPTDAQYDLVICNFVLHWVDRHTLLHSIAEIDRCLVDGGFLLLGDFSPMGFVRTPYHHAAGVQTFKQQYADILLATGLYHPVAMLSGGHGQGLDAWADEGNRTATWLLRKCAAAHYAERPR